MQRSLEQILNIILHSGEMLEEEMKSESDLKSLTARQLYCLELIREMENPSLSELAERMNISKASMSVMIERLERNILIYKVASDKDRRIAHVHLTEAGERAASLHKDLHRRIAELLTGDMTESEKEILIVLLNKSVKSLKKHQKTPH
jgi:DNA-binding MarR family transcriptional regulator